MRTAQPAYSASFAGFQPTAPAPAVQRADDEERQVEDDPGAPNRGSAPADEAPADEAPAQQGDGTAAGPQGDRPEDAQQPGDPATGPQAGDPAAAAQAAQAAAGAQGPSAGEAPDIEAEAEIIADEDDEPPSPEDMAAKVAESDAPGPLDDPVPSEGTAPPTAVRANAEAAGAIGSADTSDAIDGAAAAVGRTGAAGFHDGGRAGTIPFGCLLLSPIGRTDRRPRALTTGGRTASVPWIGGGVDGGPKGNQKAGSFTTPPVAPDYDGDGHGPVSRADAWVVPGTGTVEVHRDYKTSNAGDQGNGWWISSQSAAALETHEQRHISATEDQYHATIDGVMDRIARSRSLGKKLAYFKKDAKILLADRIGWQRALQAFVDGDNAYNAPNAQIDTEDFGALGYPHNFGARKIGGKDYDHYAILTTEADPD
jgi:hypothetical protein